MTPDEWGSEEKKDFQPAGFSRPGEEPPADTPQPPPAPEPPPASEPPPEPPPAPEPEYTMSASAPSGGGSGAPGGAFREPQAAIEHGYQVDIGGNLSRAWNLMTQNLGVFLGLGVIVLVFQSISYGLSVMGEPAAMLSYLFNWGVGPIIGAGMFIVTARAVMGNKPDLGEFTKGLGYYLQVFLLNIVMGILIMIGIFLLIIPGIYLAVAWSLAQMLIIDRDLDFWTAMETSRRIVTRNWWTVFGAVIVFGLVGISGAIVFGVGMLFTMPLAMIAVVMLYEGIIGFKKADY